MIDTHAHIISEFYNDIEDIIKDCKKSKVLSIINCADTIETTYEVVKLSKKHKNFLYPAIGIHPQNIMANWKEQLNELEEIIKKEKVVAIGEIGLDYYHEKDNKEEQKELFISQIELSKKYNLPVLIHSRDATEDCLNILKETKPKGIVHCFTGSIEIAREYIKIGLYLGIGGVITFKNSHLSEVIKEIPLEHIVLETDSPFLAPHPYRGKQNSPKYLKEIAEKIAESKNITLEEVINQATNNAKKIFNIKG